MLTLSRGHGCDYKSENFPKGKQLKLLKVMAFLRCVHMCFTVYGHSADDWFGFTFFPCLKALFGFAT